MNFKDIEEFQKKRDREMKEQINQITEEKERKLEHERNMLKSINAIEKNTANLNTVIELMKDNTDIYMVIIDLLAISQENNKEEAKSKYRKVMDKINTGIEDHESVIKLTTFAVGIYKALSDNGIIHI